MILIALALGVAALAVGGLATRPARVMDAVPAEPLPDATALAVPAHVRAIVVGGGPTPELNQVSLEDDVALARDVLDGDDTIVLYAGGPGTRAVQEQVLDVEGDPVVFGLGNLFSPRGGRDAHYRPTRLALHGGATLDEILGALEIAVADGDAPLLFYFSGHGGGGKEPRESTAETWGGSAFDASTLVSTLEDPELGAAQRRMRFVITSCYSGGFAEIAFRGADEALGVTDQDRCGIFSTTWDRESGGCDADPDRGRHEGFGVHFLNALRGHDRLGGDAHERIDLDHDGQITLAEALAYVRVVSGAIDVPTTTSERLLRSLAPEEGPTASVPMREEHAVVEGLLASLHLADVEAARTALHELESRRDETARAAAEAYAEAEEHALSVGGVLLSRWPVLDDPYHPDYPRTLAESHDALRAFFETDEEVAVWAEASDDAAALDVTTDALEVQVAMHMRLVRAADTIAMAERLAAVGGEDWARYERMRACEGSVP